MESYNELISKQFDIFKQIEEMQNQIAELKKNIKPLLKKYCEDNLPGHIFKITSKNKPAAFAYIRVNKVYNIYDVKRYDGGECMVKTCSDMINYGLNKNNNVAAQKNVRNVCFWMNAKGKIEYVYFVNALNAELADDFEFDDKFEEILNNKNLQNNENE